MNASYVVIFSFFHFSFFVLAGGKFKKWQESPAKVIKCDEPSVHQKDVFVGLGHENSSEFVNPHRQHSGIEGNTKIGCE